MNKKKKKFDCVEMKNKIQEKIFSKIKDMNPDEELEYLSKRMETGSLAAFWRELVEPQNRNVKKAANG